MVSVVGWFRSFSHSGPSRETPTGIEECSMKNQRPEEPVSSNRSPQASADIVNALRQGDPVAQELLVTRYRHWLHLLARLQVESHFRGKFDASDLVQQTLLEACRDLPQFRGQTEAELLAWLRQILTHVLAHEIRRFRGTQQRN